MVRIILALSSLACVARGLRVSTPRMSAAPASRGKLAILGGGGYVGREVARRAVARGWTVSSLSRRGANPEPGDANLDAVEWVAGDATDAAVVDKFVGSADAVAHCVGLLFDADAGALTRFSSVVSGSGSVPAGDSTYDRITRLTALNSAAAASKPRLLRRKPTPFAFISCAEAGWPDVQFGDVVESRLAPEWLRRYLKAKRAVEAELETNANLRPIILRPSLIWDWSKLDVLPAIPVFNLLSAVGVPFVDRTMRVTDLADAAVAGLEDDAVSGVQRFEAMDALAAGLRK